jgi:bacillithiol system protein YtxJ
MHWIKITQNEDLEQLKSESFKAPVLIFKHSTRCGTSALVIDKLERRWDETETSGIQAYYLDLIRHRDLSNQIEREFGVYHESPQVIIIHHGKAVYDASHFLINYSNILDELEKVSA